MIRFWKSLISDRNKAVRRFNLVAVFLLCISSLAVAASSPQQTLGNSHYILEAKWKGASPCVGQTRQLEVTLKFEIHEKIGRTEKERGKVREWQNIPGKIIKLIDPPIGTFTGDTPVDLEGGPKHELLTGPTGRAYSTFTAEKVGEETILLTTSWKNEKEETVGADTPLKIIVKKCRVTSIINLDAKAKASKGAVTYLGVGGGDAKIGDNGQISSGDGELSITANLLGLPEQCTSAESSGKAPFTISGDIKEDTLNLQFGFSDLTIPTATFTCTFRGVSIPIPVPWGGGDPGTVLGFHELSMSADGGTASFPIPVTGYTGGTTVVVVLVPEESATSNINPLDPLAASLYK